MIHFLSAKVNTSKQEVANASKSAEDILNVLETLVESFDMKEEYVRKKMAEWSVGTKAKEENPNRNSRVERLSWPCDNGIG